MIRVPEHSHIGPRDVGSMTFATDADRVALAQTYQDLARIGITFHPHHVAAMQNRYFGMDADLVAPNVTQASITTPVQFLQAWLPGFVHDVTAARLIDDFVGVTTQGSWEDEEIVQGVMEYTGNAVPYGDYTNIPMSSWNVNFVTRTIIRFEEGLQVGVLEAARAANIRVNAAEAKRAAASRALEIERNRIGFNGYNGGANRTYGFLNEPGLPAYVNVAAGSGGATWAAKTYLEIVADLLTSYTALRVQSQEVIDPKRDRITLAVSTDAVDQLSTVSQFGNSVHDWIRENYANTRIISAPELNGANGGAGVFYMYAEGVAGTGTDDTRTFVQVVPTRFMTVGVSQQAKSYEEDYSNATAGIMLKRPYAVVRYSGIS